LNFKTKSLLDLRKFFSDLSPENFQVGVDDLQKGITITFFNRLEWFAQEHISTSRKISQNGYIPLLTKYTRRGLHNSIRPVIWKQIIQLSSAQVTGPFFTTIVSNSQQPPQQQNMQQMQQIYASYLQQLRDDVTKRRLLTDSMVHNDVKRTTDDENYFVFEDILDQVMILFSRDTTIARDATIKPVTLIGVTNSESTVTNKSDIDGSREYYPPSGVIPFEGCSTIAAPFCYLAGKVEDAYLLFRYFYTNHFCGLHTMSSHPESIISLCKCFEDLLQEADSQLFYHLLQMQVHPLEIAFNWIFHAFVGYLSVDQLFLLWDRIIGFNSLLILPVFAASLFTFRSKFLLNAVNRQEVYVSLVQR
jgi:hypothetical protein